ncbi:hypothetical protein [Rhodococcoides yunnanense]|uniref:hypothetical protein n=1 Tax=Rhodococcoides yunnanense TaxID=278209 RepID=UPI00093311C8|nr:hypothetical protein [Rhodococcus yunnanensis]
MIVEKHFGAASAAMSTAKPAYAIGKYRTITRIRSVRSDVYRAEVSTHEVNRSHVITQQTPEWHYNIDDERNRFVDVTDLHAQVIVLSDGVMMLRRSRSELGHLLLADYSSTGLRLDEWQHDGHFDDCTDGYLFTQDIRLVARTCIAWFRISGDIATTDNIGCSYRFADELPRHS